MSTAEILSTLGHLMAGIWYAAYKGNWSICDRRIYDIPIQDKQLRRELKNSLHTPIHAVILASFLYAGFFTNRTWLGFFVTLALAFVWAARRLLSEVDTLTWSTAGGIRLLGVGVSGLADWFQPDLIAAGDDDVPTPQPDTPATVPEPAEPRPHWRPGADVRHAVHDGQRADAARRRGARHYPG